MYARSRGFRSLNADFAAIEWVVSAYTLTLASMMPPARTFADRYGRKRLPICGLAIFTIALIVCGAAPNAIELNVARAVQGVGAALQLSAGSLHFRNDRYITVDRSNGVSYVLIVT